MKAWSHFTTSKHMRTRARRATQNVLAALLCAAAFGPEGHSRSQGEIGREVAIPRHLQDGEECSLPIRDLIAYGKKLFQAHFTSQEGAGRPLTKGTGAPLSDPTSPLIFPRNTNRISGPDSNSCAGCHNQPISGGAGDLSSNVFVLGQRFDFATFSGNDAAPTRGAVSERREAVTLQSVANSRATPDMFGSGYYEMLARQITADLQAIRNTIGPGQHARLTSKGISFGLLVRNLNGFRRPGISLDISLGTFERENVLKESKHVQYEEVRFRGCGRSPEGD
jgi:hypothetical protein